MSAGSCFRILVSRMLCIVFMINESKASSVPWLRAGARAAPRLGTSSRATEGRKERGLGGLPLGLGPAAGPGGGVCPVAALWDFQSLPSDPVTSDLGAFQDFPGTRHPESSRVWSWAWRGPLVDFQAELFLSEDTAHLASQRRALSRHEGDAQPRGAPRTAAPSGRPPGPEMEPRGLVWPGLRGACLELEQMFF